MPSSNLLTIGACLLSGVLVYHILTREITHVVKQNSKNKKKKRVTLSQLSKRVDHIINSTQDPRFAVVLLEKVQLEVDAQVGETWEKEWLGDDKSTDKRRERRKALNKRIQEGITHLEEEAARQPVNDMKGYRIKKDGTKTTFFHRDIDDTAKELIGDIAPKRIDSDTSTTNKNRASTMEASKTESSSASSGGSEWNSSGNTWESKMVTKEAKSLLREMIVEEAVGCSVSILKITGDVTLVMKKKRSLIFDVEVVMTLDGHAAKGCLLSGDEPTLEGSKHISKDVREKVVAMFGTFEEKFCNFNINEMTT
jgi:hypothetical protein